MSLTHYEKAVLDAIGAKPKKVVEIVAESRQPKHVVYRALGNLLAAKQIEKIGWGIYRTTPKPYEAPLLVNPAPLTDRERRMLKILSGGRCHLSDIMHMAKMSRANAGMLLLRLMDRGLVRRPFKAEYEIIPGVFEPVVPPPKPKPVTGTPSGFIAPIPIARLMGRRA